MIFKGEKTMQRILLGGTGFIGQHIIEAWQKIGIKTIVVGRSQSKIEKCYGDKVTAIDWDTFALKGKELLRNSELVVNLCGSGIGDKPWTSKRKKNLIDSRVIPTKTISKLCAELGSDSPPLFNTSGVGIYGTQEEVKTGLPPAINESANTELNPNKEFLPELAHAWEAATDTAKHAGVRVVIMRFGVVVGSRGGVIKKLSLPFQLGLGGPIASGQQAFSWIAIDDLIAAIEFLFKKPELDGAFNFVSPHCLTQREFANALGKALHRPSFMPTPAFALKVVFGQMANEILLHGQNTAPKRLREANFEFIYTELDAALIKVFN